MEFKRLKIDDLIPASYNPRKKLKPGDKEFEKIKNSIKEFGYSEPVIVNSDLTIIGGHQRVSVLQALGYSEIDCVVINIDKTKEKALNIALNKITGEWNKELLADLIKDLQDSDFDINFTGFEPPEIEQLFNSVHDKEIKEDDFDVDKELTKETVSMKGDLWLLGNHRLICADSTIPETYDKLMEGKKANLVITDPPYNVNYTGEAGKINNDNMKDEEFYNFLFSAFVNVESSMEDDASIYVFHADTEGLNFRKAFKAAGFYLSGTCIWKKQSFVLGRSPYQWQHEPVLYGWKKSGKHVWYSDRKQTTVWEFDRPSKSVIHPTMKPVNLISYPIKNSSMSNCIILDPFSGSGSTLIASEQTNRVCYTIEIDEKFVDVIVNRYIEFKGSSNDVFLIRNGKKISYKDVIK
ncbi:MAG: DNA modification methylase [Clostridiales bacterium]|nr:DNA modification methylase [Clostridiales bacterium]